MKIFSLAVVLAPPSKTCTILSQGTDLSTFSFYQRGSVSEFMSFFVKTIVERTPQGQRQSVQENNYTAHVYNRGGAEQLAGVCSPNLTLHGTETVYLGPQLSLSQTRNTLSVLRSRSWQK